MPRYFYILLVIVFIAGCGYNMVGFDKQDKASAKISFYLEQPVNLDRESDYFSVLSDESKGFFNRYSLLAGSESEADYILKVTLSKVVTSSSITSKTEQTVQADLKGFVAVDVFDKHGKNLFKKTYFSSETYNITPDLYRNIESRNNALRTVLRDIFLDFIHDFQKAIK
jgi:hypothetical protein